MGEFVRLEVDEASRVGTIRLDRPPVNALNAQVQDELLEAAQAAGQDERVGAVVLWGGEKVFAAGADIKEMNGRSFAGISARTTDLGHACEALARWHALVAGGTAPAVALAEVGAEVPDGPPLPFLCFGAGW